MPQTLTEQLSRDQQISALEKDWATNPRWKGIKRGYSAADVVRLRGSFPIEHTLARRGAEKLWDLVNNEPYVNCLGALTGGQAMQQVKAGVKAIYLSGWQVAADNNGYASMYPDQSLYPVDSVPTVVERINNTFRRADEIQHAKGIDAGDKGYIDNFAPIVPLLKTLGVGAAQFFVNSIDTKTQGLDLTVSHRTDLGAGKLNTFLAANFSKTEVTGVHAPAAFTGFEDVLLSERERLFIEQGGPRRKATLGFEYLQGKIGTDFKIIHFGPQTLGTWSGSPTPNQHYKAKTSADLSFTYSFSEKTKLTVGGSNIFNVKPTEQNPDETDNGFKYESVQFGMNGAAYFARLWHKF